MITIGVPPWLRKPPYKQVRKPTNPTMPPKVPQVATAQWTVGIVEVVKPRPVAGWLNGKWWFNQQQWRNSSWLNKKKGKTQQKRRKILVKQKKGENTVKRARWGRCFTRIFHLRKRERERELQQKIDEVGFKETCWNSDNWFPIFWVSICTIFPEIEQQLGGDVKRPSTQINNQYEMEVE